MQYWSKAGVCEMLYGECNRNCRFYMNYFTMLRIRNIAIL